MSKFGESNVAPIPTHTTTEQARQGKLLEVKDLRVHFPIIRGLFRKLVGYVKAVDGVSFDIYSGETLGLVGESGCGKTTVGRTITRINNPTSGNILFRRTPEDSVDLAAIKSHKQLKPFRKEIRMVFQDPHSSLNPRMTVLEIVGEPLKLYGLASGKELEESVTNLLQKVGLRPEYIQRYPHAFSGGERQRIGIARALALNPKLIIADEAVSALDVSVQAQSLNLFRELQVELGLTYLFIAHDLSVVEHLSDRVAVMYVGRLVELAKTEHLFSSPKHPYTEALLSAIPVPDPRSRKNRERIRLKGEVADSANPPSGCYFHPRCKYVQKKCKTETPRLRRVAEGHYAACHFSETLGLKGV